MIHLPSAKCLIFCGLISKQMVKLLSGNALDFEARDQNKYRVSAELINNANKLKLSGNLKKF